MKFIKFYENEYKTVPLQRFRLEIENINNRFKIILKGVEKINQDKREIYELPAPNNDNEIIITKKEYGKLLFTLLSTVITNVQNIGIIDSSETLFFDFNELKKVTYPYYCFFFDIEKGQNTSLDITNAWYIKKW